MTREFPQIEDLRYAPLYRLQHSNRISSCTSARGKLYLPQPARSSFPSLLNVMRRTCADTNVSHTSRNSRFAFAWFTIDKCYFLYNKFSVSLTLFRRSTVPRSPLAAICLWFFFVSFANSKPHRTYTKLASKNKKRDPEYWIHTDARCVPFGPTNYTRRDSLVEIALLLLHVTPNARRTEMSNARSTCHFSFLFRFCFSP